MKPKIWIFCLLFLITLSVNGQLDTNYVVRYNDRLVVSLFQGYRYQKFIITQNEISDTALRSTIDYTSPSRYYNGFGIDWDKISFSLSWRTPGKQADEKKTGTATARNLSVSLNAKKIRFELSHRFYQGFYDNNTVNIPNFNDTTPYYQNGDLEMDSWKVKAILFHNKRNRFSYAAAYANTQRQIKTSAAWVLLSNLYYQKIYSGQGFIPVTVSDTFYTKYRDLNRFDLAGLSISAGFSANIVIFKRLFANATLAWGPQLQYRRIRGEDGNPDYSETKLSLTSGDARFSFGYNGNYIFIYSWIMGDYSILKFEDFIMNSQLISGGVTLGYRFKFKENKVTRFIKNNKWYQML